MTVSAPLPIVQVFPTHVGMNRWAERARQWDIGIPHTRGDEPRAAKKRANKKQYSPHTWG